MLAQKATPLVDAVENRQWRRVDSLLTQGHRIDEEQPDGMTALHWATFHEKVAVIKQVLQRGANVDDATEYSITALGIACEYGSAECAAVLLEAGADPDLQRPGKITPLMLAARSGDAAIIRKLIEAGCKINARERSGQTALMWAAAAGNANAAKELLKAGADPDIKLKSGFTAFLFAARQGHRDVVDVMLDAGVDLSYVMDPKQTGGRRPRKGMSALMLTIESGHFELAMRLVEKGADPNDQRSGFAPLHAVTWVRKTKVGDDPEGDPAPVGSGDLTSLDFITELIKAGADPNLRLNSGEAKGKAKRSPKGSTPFLLASASADIPMMNLLLKHGADPSIKNVDGCNALMAAAGVGVVAVGEEPGSEEEVQEAIKMLVGLGLSVDDVDSNGETAMHGAAYRNYPGTAKLICELGADPEVWNRKNQYGWTPRMIAAGKRPGSFKHSPETIAVIDHALSRVKSN